MNQRLKKAADFGDIDSLYSIIQEDVHILDHIDQVPFVDTPLHISAAAGHTHFSLEIMRLKPSFAKKLSPKGYTPLHLALLNNQSETTLRFVEYDRNLVSLQGRGGLTPLHLAASLGKHAILDKFMVHCPKSIKILTIHKETALHIAVKNGHLESLEMLLNWIEKDGMTSVLNWKDEDGNNIMHLAALGDHLEMMELLLLKFKVAILADNLEGLTAFRIMEDKGFLEDGQLRKMVLKIFNGNNVYEYE